MTISSSQLERWLMVFLMLTWVVTLLKNVWHSEAEVRVQGQER